MNLTTPTLGLGTVLCSTLLLLLPGCDTGNKSVSATLSSGASTAGSSGGSSGNVSESSSEGPGACTGDCGGGCEIGEADIDIEIEVGGLPFGQHACTVTLDGFDCDVEGMQTAVPLILAGTGPLPWSAGDDVLVNASNGSTTIMDIVEVKDPTGLLLGLIISGDPGFQTSVEIQLLDAMCAEGDSFLPQRAVYSLGDATLPLLGAAEGVLPTTAGTYRVRQEFSGTQLGNPEQPDRVIATVFLEG